MNSEKVRKLEMSHIQNLLNDRQQAYFKSSKGTTS